MGAKATSKGAGEPKPKPAPQGDFYAEMDAALREEIPDIDDHNSDVKFWLESSLDLLNWGVSMDGFPGGKLIEIYGPNATGKTTLGGDLIKKAQALGGGGAWIDIEHGFSNRLADKYLGIDRKTNWRYVKPKNMEEAMGATEIIAVKAAKRQLPFVIIWDSVAALVPKNLSIESGVDTLEDKTPAVVARALSTFLRRGILDVIQGTPVFLVMLNQIRKNIPKGGMGPTQITPGGMAIPFYSSVRIELRKLKTLENSSKQKLGINVEAEIVKNKVGPPFREAIYPFYFGKAAGVKGLDNFTSLLSFLAGKGIFVAKSNGRFEYQGANRYIADWRNLMLADGVFAQEIKAIAKAQYIAEHGED